MFCNGCGHKAALNDRFCSRCGRPLREIRDIRPPLAVRTNSARPTPTANIVVASQSLRFINFLFDYIGIWIFVFLLLLLAAFGLGITGTYDPTAWDNSLQGLPSYALSILLFFIYYLLFEAVTGRTPGKILTGTRVVNTDGSKPDFRVILKRSALRLVPFEAFSFFGSRTPQGWHDSVSGTLVIKRR